MPWLIGVDEAGYGPNLGPFVMSSTACHVPDELFDSNLWDALDAIVCRKTDRDAARTIIDDSKAVYASGKGLTNLEKSVSALTALVESTTLSSLIAKLSTSLPELEEEVWYQGTTAIPLEIEVEGLTSSCKRFLNAASEEGITWGETHSVMVCPSRFNAIARKWNSKGGVLSETLGELIQRRREVHDAKESMHFFVDKHGGRNAYAATLQNSFPEGIVMTEHESATLSRYRVHGIEGEVTISFQPRADQDHLNVAAASMVSKYLREVLMMEFNQFWRTHLPNLKPTAGYPVDAKRFLGEIEPTMRKLGIERDCIWRDK